MVVAIRCVYGLRSVSVSGVSLGLERLTYLVLVWGRSRWAKPTGSGDATKFLSDNLIMVEIG